MIRRKDGLYQVYLSVNGKRQYFYGHSPAEVNRKINEFNEKQADAQLFRNVAEAWEKRHYEEIAYNTEVSYAPAVKRAVARFGDKNISDVTPNDIDAVYLEMKMQKYSRSTIRTQKIVLKEIFDFAVVEYGLQSNPTTYVKLPHKLPAAERREAPPDVIQVIKDNVNQPFGLFAYLLLYTGLRRGEALALQWQDIDFDTDTIQISKALKWQNNRPVIDTTKTKSGIRTVPLLPPLKEKLQAGKPEQYLFGHGDTPMTNIAYRRAWEKYYKLAGFREKWTPHQLRHSFATFLYDADTPEKDTQEIMGHSSIQVTRDIYTHISAARQQVTFADLKNKADKI